MASMKTAVLTVSTSRAQGDQEDVSGARLAELCEAAGLEVVRETVADDREAIAPPSSASRTASGCGSSSPPAAPASRGTT